MNIFEVRNQPWSMVLAHFMICKYCGIVDGDLGRAKVGYKCPRCGIPGDGGKLYFPISVHTLINLMQEFYYLKQEAIPDTETHAEQKESNYQLAVVIFFCTLAEVLLQHFFEECMSKMGLPGEIQDRLLKDNLFMRNRIQNLFPTLTGAKWREALEMLSGRVKLDYIETSVFYLNAYEARNKFLHKGNKWAIPRDMPKCHAR